MNTFKGSRESEAIYALKALAIVGVVFYHCGQPRFESGALDGIQALKWYFQWCVMAFVFVAGLLHALSEKRHNWSLPQFVRHRALRLLLPFVIIVFVYALIWQGLQKASGDLLHGTIPAGFWEKVVDSLWPVGDRSVGEQLYFLPLLFGIGVLAQAAMALFRQRGILVMLAASLLVGAFLFPQTGKLGMTGFNWATFTWGCALYCLGYLYGRHDRRMYLIMLAGICLFVFFVAGALSLLKFVPILLLLVLSSKFVPIPGWGVQVGRASGTVFAYHTPFVLQPVLIVISRVHHPAFQFYAAVIAGVVVVLVLTGVHLALERTRWKVALL